MPAQITVLLALTAELFDPIPLERMTDAESAVREAATKIPPEMSARFATAAKLSDDDRKAIIEIARLALVPFQPKPESKLEVKPSHRPSSANKNDAKPVAAAKEPS